MPGVQNNVEDIWQAVLVGDESAWAALVARFTPLMMAVARRTGLGQADADDCVQQTWFTLYQTRRTVTNPVRLKSWLTSVVQRKAARVYRQAARLERRYSKLDPVAAPELPDKQLIRLEEAILLEQAINELALQCRRVLRMLFYSPDHLSYDDVAARLRMPVNSVGPVRNRCLKKLKATLEKLGY